MPYFSLMRVSLTVATASIILAACTACSSHPSTDVLPGAVRSAAASTPTSAGSRSPGPSQPSAETSPPGLSGRRLHGRLPRLIHWTGTLHAVALTFDDGPGPYTARVLDVLGTYHVRATFCQIGEQVQHYAAVERRIARAGDTFCNHSWDHRLHMSRLVRQRVMTAADIDSEISRTTAAIRKAAGVAPAYYRSPGSDFGNPVLAAIGRSGLQPLGWAVDPDDWERPGTASIIAAVLSQVRDDAAAHGGPIVLLHDGGGDRTETVDALPQIITALRARGYRFEPLPASPQASATGSVSSLP